jgi:autotransporter passenger strand-loop-strand repeat protein
MSGGVASGAILSGGQETVASGGTDNFTVVSNGGTETVSAGGLASFTTVSNGGNQMLLGGVASGGTIQNGGVQTIEAGGIASGTVVTSGGIVSIDPGGSARAIVVSNGGGEYVYSGGIASGTIVRDGGTETVEIFGAVSATVVSSGGTEIVRYGGTVSDTVLLNGANQFAYSGAAATGTVVSSGGTEILANGATADGTVINTGGAIDLPGLTWSSGGSSVLDTGTDILTVTEGASLYQQTLSGIYANVSFRVTPDSGIGTLVTMATTSPCFVAGTRLATDRGESAVETLKPGDRVRLAGGHTAPIVWIGHRRIDCSRHPHPDQVWPVRVMAHAFAPGEPGRDLFLSPDHAVFVDDVLVPVKYLINRTSVAQVKVAEVTYYHVELAEHDVLIAEGLPVESYLDTGDRSNFDNGGAAVVLHPNFSAHIQEGRGYAMLVVFGWKIQSIRRKLKKRARIVGLKEQTIRDGRIGAG